MLEQSASSEIFSVVGRVEGLAPVVLLVVRLPSFGRGAEWSRCFGLRCSRRLFSGDPADDSVAGGDSDTGDRRWCAPAR